jgi:hypothetical protein
MHRKEKLLHTLLTSEQQLSGIMLAPVVSSLPLAIQRYDDPFLPFGKAVIQGTRDLVQIYVFDLAAYLALGGAGAVALERTIRYVDEQIITIIHGPFSRQAFAGLTDIISFGADAVTGLDTPLTGVVTVSNHGVHLVSAIIPLITVGQQAEGAADMPEYVNRIRERLLT